MNLDLKKIINSINGVLEYDLDLEFRDLLMHIQEFSSLYKDDIDSYMNSNIRFCDYYDIEKNVIENINYFDDNYKNDDALQARKLYIIHCLFSQVMDSVDSFRVFEPSEHKDICGMYIEDIKTCVNLLNEINKKELDGGDDLSFLTDNKYKIFFTGRAFDDIKDLDKNELASFIYILREVLSRDDVVKGAETMDHVKDLSGVALNRIYLGRNHRIAFLRRGRTTAIVGVAKKTGKNIDYSRYDNFFVNKRSIGFLAKVECFDEGTLSDDPVHVKTVEYLRSKISKIDSKKK